MNSSRSTRFIVGGLTALVLGSWGGVSSSNNLTNSLRQRYAIYQYHPELKIEEDLQSDVESALSNVKHVSDKDVQLAAIGGDNNPYAKDMKNRFDEYAQAQSRLNEFRFNLGKNSLRAKKELEAVYVNFAKSFIGIMISGLTATLGVYAAGLGISGKLRHTKLNKGEA